jgi:DinB family protein
MKGKKKELIRQLKDLILKGNAHVTLDDALDNVPVKLRGVVPDNLPYSLWQIAEHIRLAQWDILDFCRNPDYKPLKWPEEYWSKKKAPKSASEWDNTLSQIKKDRDEFIALLEDEEADLYTPFAHGDGQNLLREALLIADHNSCHTGEVIVIRRLLGAWR